MHINHHASRFLQLLYLNWCKKLQKLPSSIGQLTALQKLYLKGCGSLEALPDSITALSSLRSLSMRRCPSISKLPTSFIHLYMDEGHALALGQLNTLRSLMVTQCTDHDTISVLDSLGTLRNLQQLSRFNFDFCQFMTKLGPETIGLLTNLDVLNLYGCDKLEKLPNSIGQLKLLRVLYLRYCLSLETLPGSVGALTCLRELCIVMLILQEAADVQSGTYKPG